MSSTDPDEVADNGRRGFIKKLAIGTAFAAPVVSSFSMSGVSAAYAQTPTASGQVDSTDATTPNSTTTTTNPNTTTTTTNPNSTDPSS